MQSDEMAAGLSPVLACILQRLVEKNDQLAGNSTLSKFHAVRAPSISIKDYLLRIGKYAACSGECFVLALVYIDRIIQNNPNFIVSSLNIHRLLITSVMLAAKFYDDQYYNNAYFGKVGGVPCNEISSLEVEFLFMCNFSLAVPAQQYEQYYTELYNHARQISNTCSCYQQHTKIPELKFPVPDAGTIPSDHPILFADFEEKQIDSGHMSISPLPRSSPIVSPRGCSLGDTSSFDSPTVSSSIQPTC